MELSEFIEKIPPGFLLQQVVVPTRQSHFFSYRHDQKYPEKPKWLDTRVGGRVVYFRTNRELYFLRVPYKIVMFGEPNNDDAILGKKLIQFVDDFNNSSGNAPISCSKDAIRVLILGEDSQYSSEYQCNPNPDYDMAPVVCHTRVNGWIRMTNMVNIRQKSADVEPDPLDEVFVCDLKTLTQLSAM